MKKYITPKDYEIASKNGIKKDTVRRRVVRNNWSIEEAITTPSQRYDLPKELLEEAEKLGIERQRVIGGYDMSKKNVIAISANILANKLASSFLYFFIVFKYCCSLSSL